MKISLWFVAFLTVLPVFSQKINDRNAIATFWDEQYSEPILITCDSLLYRGFEKNEIRFEPLDLDDSNLNLLKPIIIKDTVYLVEQSGGVVVQYFNRTFKRIDKSFTHRNQYGSIPFVYNDELYLLGGYGLFTAKNILTKFNFKTKEWFLVDTYGEKPIEIYEPITNKIENELFFFVPHKNPKNFNKGDDIKIYKLNLESMFFVELGILNMKEFNVNSSTIGIMGENVLLQQLDGAEIYLLDFKNNLYSKLNSSEIIHPSMKVLKKEDNQLLTQTFNWGINNVEYIKIDSSLFEQHTNSTAPLYKPKSNTYIQILFVSFILIITVIIGLMIKRYLKDYKYIKFSQKNLTITYKLKRLNIFDENEVRLLSAMAISKHDFVLYSDLLNIFESDKDSYDTLRKKRKALIDSIIEKFKKILNKNAENIFIYKTDANDKRSKLIKLNEKLIRVID